MEKDRLRCARCLFPVRACLCADVPRVATRTQVVIVRHHRERWRSSNSGRLAHLALPNSLLVDHGGLPGPAALPPLDDAWLVYPEGEPARAPIDRPPARLVVLDGTWPQARRMYLRLSSLRRLPVLRLPDDDMPAARLRKAPAPGRVSTIEAIARALRLVEGETVATPLERLFGVAVARASALG